MTAVAEQPKAMTPPAVKSLGTFPSWAKLRKRLDEIESARRDCEERITTIAREIASANDRDEARDLLDLSTPFADATADARDVPALQIERASLYRERDQLVLAHRQGEAELRKIAREIGPEAAASVVAAHRKLIERTARTLLDLLGLARAEGELLGSLESAGLSATIAAPHGPCSPAFFDQQDLANWLRDRIAEGTLPRVEPWVSASRP